MLRTISFALVLAASLATAATADAQLLNTWVSGTGDDDNPCSRALPCRTFNGAIAKTNAGGVIGVLDPGEYSAVEITKSITIDGGGTFASILTSSVIPAAITVRAGPNDRVVVRNLSISGLNNVEGVLFETGRMLALENCMFSRGATIEVANPTRSNLYMNNVLVVRSAVSVRRPFSVGDPPGFAIAVLNDVQIELPAGYNGIAFSHSTGLPSSATITGSLFASHGYPTGLIRAHGDANIDNSVFVHSRSSLGDGSASASMRLSGNLVMNHQLGFGSSTTRSFGDNAVDGILGGPVNTSPIAFQ